MRQRTALLLFVTFIVSACFTYYAAADCIRYRAACLDLDKETYSGQHAPYRYRLLEPSIMQPFMGSQDFTIVGAIIWQLVLNAITFPLLYSWLSRHLSSDRALLGLMICGLVNVAAFHLWFISLGILLELACLALLLTLLERSWWVLLPIVVVASFNRETAVYLALIYTVWHWSNPVKRRGGFVLIGTWAIITGGLHLILGPSEHVNGNFLGMFEYNIGNIIDAFFANLILSPLFWLAWRGYRRAEPRFKHLTLVAVGYLVAACIGGNWGEMQRYLLMALPIFLIPMLSETGGRLPPVASSKP